MSDQYDEPVVPRLATSTATGSGSFTQGESAPGEADQEPATSGHSTSAAETPVVPRLGGTASASDDPADPLSPAEYWSARDNEPVASRRGTADASDGLDHDSVIVILPEDIVTPDDDEEEPKASEPTQPTLATEPIRWNASAAASSPETPAADSSHRDPEPAAGSEPEDSPAPPSDLSDDVETDQNVSDDTGADLEPEADLDEVADGGDEAGRAVLAEAGPKAVDGVADERWREIMVGFVDDPRASVEAAAALIEDEIAAYVARLAARQQSMRSGWNTGQDTEMFRVALRGYRDFRVRFTEEVDRVDNAGG